MTSPQSQRRSTGGVFRGASAAAVAFGVAQAFNALAFLLLARRVGSDVFGEFVVLYTVSTVAGTLLDFGSSQKITRELALGMSTAKFMDWLRSRAAWQSIPGILLAVGAAGFVDGFPKAAAAILVLQAIVMSAAQAIGGAVRALRSAPLASLHVAVGNLVFLGCAAWPEPTYAIVLSCLAAPGSWMLTCVLGWRSLPRRRTRARWWRGNPWVGSGSFGLFGIGNLLPGLATVVVGVVAGANSAGALGAVSRWSQPAMLLVGAYGTMMYPRLARAESDAAAFRMLRTGVLMLVSCVLFALVLAVAAGPAVDLLLGDEYAESGPLLRWSALSVIPVVFAYPASVYLQARGRERFVGLVSLTLASAGFLSVCVLARDLGARIAPMSATFSGGMIALLFVWRSIVVARR